MMIAVYYHIVGKAPMLVYQERWLFCAVSLALFCAYTLARTSAASEDLVGDYERLQARIDDGSLVTLLIGYEEDVYSYANLLYKLPPGIDLLLTRNSNKEVAEVAVWIATEGPTKGLFVGHLHGPCDHFTANELFIQLKVIRISLATVGGQKMILAHAEHSMGGN